MYITVFPFIDLQDEEHGYNKGDVFPRPEAIYVPTQERYDQIVEAGFIVEQVESKPKGRTKTTDESEE